MKTLIISALLLSSNAFSQARYCDAVVTTSAHEWGVEVSITSAASEGTDCFFGIEVRPMHESAQTKLRWLLSRIEPSPARFLTDDGCLTLGSQLNCGIGLKSGASATILGVRRVRVVGAVNANCYTASAQNNSFFSGAVGLQPRPIRTICLPE